MLSLFKNDALYLGVGFAVFFSAHPSPSCDLKAKDIECHG